MPNGFSMQSEAKKNEALRLEEQAQKQKSSTERIKLEEKAKELRRQARQLDYESGFNY